METTIFGPPGAGKTTKLLSLVDDALKDGIPPERIGFFSFSKAAAGEAVERACEKFGRKRKEFPWFRTLHSLAFQTLGIKNTQIMGHEDYKKFSDYVGVPFSSFTQPRSNLLWRQNVWREGDDYLNIIMKARCLRLTAEEVYEALPKHDAWKLFKRQLLTIEDAFPKFKKVHNKFDYVDLCERFIEEGHSPEFDLLIVDEAQDLVPLQWEMLKKVMVPRAKRTYYAGDDDQAIYQWMGVRVGDFLNASEDKIILDKSHRISKGALDIAQSVSSRISKRQHKEFMFKHKNGQVRWHRKLKQIDLYKGREEGEDWLILCRTNSQVEEVAQQLLRDCHYFYTEGKGWSANRDVLLATEIWLKISKLGARVTWQELHDLTLRMRHTFWPKKGDRKRMLKRIYDMDRDQEYSFADLVRKTQLIGKIHDKFNWYDIVDASDWEIVYLGAVRARGERILGRGVKPRIRLSTIHSAKGKEADNVVLYTRITKTIRKRQRVDSDAEDRIFYVGLTRARRDLHIIEEYRHGKVGYRIE